MKNRHKSKHLQRSFNKYREQAFEYSWIPITVKTDQTLNTAEKLAIYLTQSSNPKFGYNKTLGGDGGIPTKETRKKLSEVKLGKKHGPMSAAQRKAMSTARPGKPKSEATRKAMSEARKGKPRSQAFRKAISKAISKRQLGKKRGQMSEAQRKAISKAMSKAKLGKPLSDANKTALSKAYWTKMKKFPLSSRSAL